MVGLTIQIEDKLALPVVNIHINTTHCAERKIDVDNLVCRNGKSAINIGRFSVPENMSFNSIRSDQIRSDQTRSTIKAKLNYVVYIRWYLLSYDIFRIDHYIISAMCLYFQWDTEFKIMCLKLHWYFCLA